MTQEKRCTRCGATKPLEEFHRNRRAKDGRESRCAGCHLAQDRERIKSNPKKAREVQARYWDGHREMQREHNRKYRQRNSEQLNEAKRQWKKANPEKVAAHRAVHRAVKAGRLVRPDQCEGCGASGEIQAHHRDYSKQLEVRWLCRSCHGSEHRKYVSEKEPRE